MYTISLCIGRESMRTGRVFVYSLEKAPHVRNMPSVFLKNIPTMVKNQAVSIQHVESLISFAKANKTIDSDLYKEYLSRYAQMGDHSRVAKEISSMESQGFPVDTSVMNIHLMSLQFHPNSNAPTEILENIRKRGLEPDEDTYMHLLHHFMHVRNEEAARLISDHMMTQSHAFSRTAAFNAQLHIHSRRGDVQECESLRTQMSNHGVPCDSATYRALLEVHARSGNVVAARKVLVEMEEAGLVLDSSAHCVVLIACARRMDIVHCKEILEEMRDRGITPQYNAYIALLEAAGSASKHEDTVWAVELLLEMREVNMHLPLKVYARLVEMCWNTGATQALTQTITSMREDLVSPCSVYQQIMDKCDKEGNTDKALALGEDLMERKEPLNEQVYSKLISLYEKKGMVGNSVKLVNKARSEGLNPHIYSSLFIKCYRAGDMVSCSQLWETMKVKGNVEVEVYNKMIAMKIKQGEIMDASNILEDMERNGTTPSASNYHRVIASLSKMKEWDICITTFDRVKAKGIIPYPRTYDIMFNVYAKKKNFGMCKKLWDEASTILSEEDRNTSLNSMISIYAMAGDVQNALLSFKEINQKGSTPTEEACISLFKALGKVGNLKAIAGVFGEIVENNIPHGVKLYNTLLMIFVEHDCVDKGKISLASLFQKHGKQKELDAILVDVN